MVRFDPFILTKRDAGTVYSRHTEDGVIAGGNLTARQIAEQWDCPEYTKLLAKLEQSFGGGAADAGGGGGGGAAMGVAAGEENLIWTAGGRPRDGSA